ncbi:MAG: YegP family protein [Devosia sp.]|nr:YegP family protein [Devosia sp.]
MAGSKDGQFFVRFVASNGETMVRSETYTRRASAVKCIESLKARAVAAETVEEL